MSTQPVPGPQHPSLVATLRQTRAFMADWAGFIQQQTQQHQSTVFRASLGIPLIVLSDHQSTPAVFDLKRFHRPYGFGPRSPSVAAIGEHVPTIFSRGEAHQTQRAFVKDYLHHRHPSFHQAVEKSIDRALRQWGETGTVEVGPAVDTMVAQLLGGWLLDEAPDVNILRDLGDAVLPVRLKEGKVTSKDRALKPRYDAFVQWIQQTLGFRSAPLGGLTADDAARDLAFVLIVNAWGALSGAITSTVAELGRHPHQWHQLTRNPSEAHIDGFVLEVLRLHPPAPVIFGVAQQDTSVASPTGTYDIAKGETVMALLASAQRDPRVFDAPDDLLPDRYSERSPPLYWAGGPSAAEPTSPGKTCPGRDPARTILNTFVRKLLDTRWSLEAPVNWGTSLNPRNVPSDSVALVGFRWQDQPTPLNPPRSVDGGDLAKLQTVRRLRRFQRSSVERWSRTTYRRTSAKHSPFSTATAQAHYGATDIPSFLQVPSPDVPHYGTMGTGHVIPYYIMAGLLFMGLEKRPIDPRVQWTPEHPSNRWFPGSREGWDQLQDDDAFVDLRTQGPNPFLLTGEGQPKGMYVVDYGPAFKGVAPPVCCRFGADSDGLKALSITIDEQEVTPKDPGWHRAKLLANALDARLDIFVQHLMLTHLTVAQAFSLSRFTLPGDHPIRGLLDLHTYATLQVNDFAYKLLVSPSSYFIGSGFISRRDAFQLFDNAWPQTSMNHLMPDRDIERRGLGHIPGHAYVEEAIPAYNAILQYVRDVVDHAYTSDEQVAADSKLQGWAQELLGLLPTNGLAAGDRDGLTRLLACVVYNNVHHEIVGDFSPYFSGEDPEQVRLVRLDRLLQDCDDLPPMLSDVFLMKQGAWSGRFDTGGNNLMRLDLERAGVVAPVREAMGQLRSTLTELEKDVNERNKSRRRPFLRMRPSKWELSIGF